MTTVPAWVLAPERIGDRHDLSLFENGRHPSLDEWLRRRAQGNEGLASRTYVCCEAAAPDRVVGYYALATAMEQRAALPSARMRQGLPDQVPLLLVGRLAVDHRFRGRGLGSSMLGDAVRRCLAVSEMVGARGVLTHAIDEDAATFYRRHGFQPCLLGDRVLLLPIESARQLFTA